MNSFHKTVLLVILAISTYSYAEDYEHKGVSHAEAHSSGQLKETLVISQPDVVYTLFLQASKLILIEAYTRIGQKIEFETLPVERSLDLANKGVTDGELARISGLQNEYPNLIQVPAPTALNRVFAYSKKHNFPVKGWQSLKPYKIDFIFGSKYLEQKSKGFQATKVKSNYQGLKKLSAGRSDFYVGLFGVKCSINKHNFTGIKMLTPALDEMNMYHYMHKRYKHIAEKLTVVLKQMKQNGEMELMQEQATQELLRKCS